jgi:hypothetical protein
MDVMQPLLAASDWGLAVAIGFVLLAFVAVGWVVIQGTRLQLYWRKRVMEGDVDAIQIMVGDEIQRWKTARAPRGIDTSVWHGVQSAELMEVAPDGVRLSATAEGQYALVNGERREVSNALNEAFKVTAKVADMVLYDIPNVYLPWVRVDIYSTYRDEQSASQRCIMTTQAEREIANDIDWDALTAEEVVRRFGGRYALDDRGNAIPINVDAPARNSVPAAFYKDDE